MAFYRIINAFRRLPTQGKALLLFAAGYSGFGVLGFYRGCEHYDYYYNQGLSCIRKEELEAYIEENPHLCTSKAWLGFFMMIFYTFPGANIFVLPKEIYRLEVNIRGLKKTRKYYEIF